MEELKLYAGAPVTLVAHVHDGESGNFRAADGPVVFHVRPEGSTDPPAEAEGTRVRLGVYRGSYTPPEPGTYAVSAEDDGGAFGRGSFFVEPRET